ncbi:MAG: hypothetical protein KFH98_10345 [Gemmatimonadetes bacterium]|nr:hypothetical protein [Gemmatimonadota bacterium]
MTTVLAALRRPREAFDAALTSAIDELHTFLADQSAPVDEHVAQEAARLGQFAAGRIDIDRFSALVGRGASVSPAALARIRRVHELLTAFRAQGDSLYNVRVDRGSDLRDIIRNALAARGRMFNAARHVELLRAGAEINEPDDTLCFTRWLRSERLLAPPLVVEVEGSDLMTDGLSEYLDGAVKIVLLVNGPAPAAPLARLIAPNTYVMQTSDPEAVSGLGDFQGAGIAAVLPDGCARFTHDPARGAMLSKRLHVDLIPDVPPRAIGRYNARRQAEEEGWLRELAQLADMVRAEQQVQAELAPAGSEPADQLAGWLLRAATIDTAGREA